MGEGKKPEVSVVIPHWKGEDILRHTLESLRNTEYSNFNVIVVNNNSPDKSIEVVHRDFPEVRVVDSEINLGFAAGCNLGIREASTKYVALLNNDTEVTPMWLAYLVDVLEKDSEIAAVQPKLLWFYNRNTFDYSGGAGGEIDIFGYPFTLGRVFEFIEQDIGQYDTQREIFWASGAAVVIRRSVLNYTGLLDEAFFAHMEEIDLQWRFHIAGFKVVNCPRAVVYHRAGATLGKENVRKMILNHRNNLVMLLKNYQMETIVWLMPVRVLLEIITVGFGVILLDFKRSFAAFYGLFSVIGFIPHILRERKKVSAIRSVSDKMIRNKMFRGSIVKEHFIKGKRTTSELL
ncbi:glycosyltransferase family 2 protein [bacterium]|nr:glycosyltransferase family 2 protein [bacterium]